MIRLINYLQATSKVIQEIRLQKHYQRKFLIPYLQELEIKFEGQFAPEQKRKILQYYGLFITAFLCSSYTRLRGRPITEAERKRATLFGILTPVGDDLFDVVQLDNEKIAGITTDPDKYEANSFTEKVAKAIQSFLIQDVVHQAAYLDAARQVLHIQIETVKQRNPAISKQELELITYTKGAVSVIIYHQCLNDMADKQMQEALSITGSLFQLGNDLFDLYKDVNQQQYTLVNTCEDFISFKQEFLNRIQLQNEKIMALPFAKKNKQIFCFVMNSINARSLVAIDHLINLQKKYGKKINWWQMPRKTMIVDMEKPGNILKWLRYAYTINKNT